MGNRTPADTSAGSCTRSCLCPAIFTLHIIRPIRIIRAQAHIKLPWFCYIIPHNTGVQTKLIYDLQVTATMKLSSLAAAAGLVASSWASSSNEQSQKTPTYQHLPPLREQADLQDKWVAERKEAIPKLLEKHGVDAWLVSRPRNKQPFHRDLRETSLTYMSCLVRSASVNMLRKQSFGLSSKAHNSPPVEGLLSSSSLPPRLLARLLRTRGSITRRRYGKTCALCWRSMTPSASP